MVGEEGLHEINRPVVMRARSKEKHRHHPFWIHDFVRLLQELVRALHARRQDHVRDIVVDDSQFSLRIAEDGLLNDIE